MGLKLLRPEGVALLGMIRLVVIFGWLLEMTGATGRVVEH
jgi:hypothetical protein